MMLEKPGANPKNRGEGGREMALEEVMSERQVAGEAGGGGAEEQEGDDGPLSDVFVQQQIMLRAEALQQKNLKRAFFIQGVCMLVYFPAPEP